MIGKCFLMLSLLIILGGWFYSFVNNALDLSVEYVPYQSELCRIVSLPLAPEDLSVYKQKAITAIDDRITSMFLERGAKRAKQGMIVLVDPQIYEYEEIPIKFFPDNLAFHPHGQYLYKNFLYVINHALGSDGDRVEIFEIVNENGKFLAKFQRGILFGMEYSGVLNDLVVKSENEIYLSQWIPRPLSPEGRGKDFWSKFHLYSSFVLRRNYLHFCDISSPDGKPRCSVQDTGYIFNGMTLRKNQLFVVDSVIDRIFIYDIQPNSELNQVGSISVTHNIDNIEYIEEFDAIYTSGVIRVKDVIELDERINRGEVLNTVPGHATQLVLSENEWVETVLVRQDSLSFPSAAVRIGNKVLFGSVTSSGILICEDLEGLN